MTEEEKRKPGRPRKYPKDKGSPHGGAPQFSVRLEPHVLEWVQCRGGAHWVRRVLAAACEKGRLDPEDLAPLTGAQA